jgi:hypothetical protein
MIESTLIDDGTPPGGRIREASQHEAISQMQPAPLPGADNAQRESRPVCGELLATKFFVPVSPCPLIPRPHLLALLDAGLHRQFTLVSAPAGFGKTALLSTWVQSHPSSNSHMAWATLDDQDNQPRRFWEYVLTALGQREPGIIA